MLDNENQKTYQSATLLATILRDCRTRAGLSRARVALRGHMSASVVEKWELNGAIPKSESLASWFVAVKPPELYRKKIIELTQAALFPEETEHAPTQIQHTDHDLQHLDAFPHPACYHSTSVFDITAANDAFYQTFPGLESMDAIVDGPPNLLLWHMRHPAARTTVRDWHDRTHALLTRFRIQAPGTVPGERIEQIRTACEQAHEFGDMWKKDPHDDVMNDPALALLGQDLKWHHFTTKTYRFQSPSYLSLLSVVPKR